MPKQLKFSVSIPINNKAIHRSKTMDATDLVNEFRTFLRTDTELVCQVTFEKVNRDAVIINLSLEGACLSSNFLPPIGSAVTICLQSPLSEITLSMQGRVIHHGGIKFIHIQPHRFGIRFKGVHSEIARLTSNLK